MHTHTIPLVNQNGYVFAVCLSCNHIFEDVKAFTQEVR
jgi:hypothetical protein